MVLGKSGNELNFYLKALKNRKNESQKALAKFRSKKIFFLKGGHGTRSKEKKMPWPKFFFLGKCVPFSSLYWPA